MQALGVEWKTHLPGQGWPARDCALEGQGRATLSHAKEVYETLYHFHKPETEAQANGWLLRYLLRYNDQRRSEPHSRLEDWVANLPRRRSAGDLHLEQFCRFAREPEQRKVGPDARIRINGTEYEVEPDLAGDTVVLLWGLFDDELYAEYDGVRLGPHHPLALSRCIAIELSNAPNPTNAPTASDRSPINSRCRSRRSPGMMYASRHPA